MSINSTMSQFLEECKRMKTQMEKMIQQLENLLIEEHKKVKPTLTTPISSPSLPLRRSSRKNKGLRNNVSTTLNSEDESSDEDAVQINLDDFSEESSDEDEVKEESNPNPNPNHNPTNPPPLPLRRSTRKRVDFEKEGYIMGKDLDECFKSVASKYSPLKKPSSASKEKEFMSSLTLDKARRLTRLSSYTVVEMLNVFKNCVLRRVGDKPYMSRGDYNRCFRKLYVLSQDDTESYEKKEIEILVDKLWDTFVEDNDNVVWTELMSGLTVLCDGNRDEKTKRMFKLYTDMSNTDRSNTDSMDYETLTTYLTSVFKVLYLTIPGTLNRMGTEAKELACVCADEIFLEYGISSNKDVDVTITLRDLKKWYSI